VKVHQQAHSQSGALQIREHLIAEHGVVSNRAFQFEDDLLLDDKIGSALADRAVLVDDGYEGLANEVEPLVSQLDAHGGVVTRLEESSSEPTMHRDPATNDSVCEFFKRESHAV
jgi:hypothetical protein